jgi:hypothetical protein
MRPSLQLRLSSFNTDIDPLRRFVLIVVFLMASACVGPTTPTYRVNQQFTLEPGFLARIAETSIRIRFEGVVNDSRCPADAVCIQGGDALVRIQVLPDGSQASTHDLHTANTNPVTYQGLTIALVQLTPYPISSRTIAQSEYRATLLVTR